MLLGVLLATAGFGQSRPCDPGNLLETEDSAFVCLHREESDGHPVLLLHGISSNHRFWDLNEANSLSLHLQAAGFDVWNLDFRGHGAALFKDNGRRQTGGWHIDDYGEHDIKSAVDHIREQTQRAQVSVVAHSMGGMAMAIYFSAYGDASIRSLVIAGSPMSFEHPDILMRLASSGRLSFFPVPTPLFGRVAARLPRSPLEVDDLMWNPENVAQDTRKELLREIVSPMTAKELQQLADILIGRRFVSADETVDYEAALKDVSVPSLVIAGRADQIAPADRVYAYYDLLGGEANAFVLAGRSQGFATDYGHLDLSLARNAPTELYPIIEDWLTRHSIEGAPSPTSE